MITEYGIRLGPLSIEWYGVIIMFGAMLALYLATKEAEKFGGTAEEMIDLFFLIMIFGIIGARIYYVAFEFDTFRYHILRIFRIWEGGIAIYGGIIGGAIAAIVYCKKHKLNTILMADFIFPVLMLAQSIGRWGNFINKEAYGGIVPGMTPADQVAYLKQFFIPNFIINRMNINGVYYQPTFLYESLWNIIGFLVIYLVIRNWKQLKQGMLSLCYFVWYGIGRFIIEGMRSDSLYIFGDIRVSQVVSIIIIIVGIIGFIYILSKKDKIPYYRKSKLYLDEQKNL